MTLSLSRVGALSVFLLVVGTGCAASNDHGSTGDDQDLTEGQVDTTNEVNGMTPAAFYAQLIYRRPAPLHHEFPSSDLVKLPSGNKAQIELFMRDDHTYTASYTEWKPLDATRSEQIHSQELAGGWHVALNQLVLDGLGVADGLTLDGRPGITLTPSLDVHEPGFTTVKPVLSMVRSSWGPDGNDP